LDCGDGDAAAAAALAGVKLDFANTVAPTTPPANIAATIAAANTRVRGLFMRPIVWAEPQNDPRISYEF
jgi:hypothetical protein